MDNLVSLLRQEASSALLIGTTAAAFVSYAATITIYRLFFSPIASFPGPKLAAISMLYQFYYDVILGGQYVFKIDKLHAKYGPVIRINPWELHVKDPDSYDKIYTGPGTKRDRWSWTLSGTGVEGSIFATLSHDLHRRRRQPMSTFFSKANVQALEPMIQGKIDLMLKRLESFKGSGQPVVMSEAFAALTSDIVMQYSFGRCDNHLEMPAFDPYFHHTAASGTTALVWGKHFPALNSIIESLPNAIANYLVPELASFKDFRQAIEKQITQIKKSMASNSTNRKLRSSDPNVGHRTIFSELLLSPDLSPSDKSDYRLGQDGVTVVTAGTLTTSWAMSVGLYHLLANPSIYSRLHAELSPYTSHLPTSSTLDSLPYLSSFTKEALRLSYGITYRTSRMSPDKPILLSIGGKTHTIPPGIPVSMSNIIQHQDPSVFPEPLEFRPERWLGEEAPDRYLVPFSKGTRACVGMNLAKTELMMAMAGVVMSGLEMELWETGREDVECVADGGIPLVRKGSKGIRVLVK